MFGSKSTGGFYDPSIHVSMPEDVVEITADKYRTLIQGQSSGKVIAWSDDGYPFLADRPPPSPAQIVAQLAADVQSHLDTAAKQFGYDDIKSAVTYADEPAVLKFQQEGIAFRVWRSLCWAYCYAQLDAVQNGERQQPTSEELIAELPALTL